MPLFLVASATDDPHKISINAIADTALKVFSAGFFLSKPSIQQQLYTVCLQMIPMQGTRFLKG